MDAVREDVIKLVHKELESANKKFPAFNSAHEGWAVMLEEIEELEEEIGMQKHRTRQLHRQLWDKIKANERKEAINSLVEEIKELSINAATESIQVAAMAQKFIDSLGGGEDNL